MNDALLQPSRPKLHGSSPRIALFFRHLYGRRSGWLLIAIVATTIGCAERSAPPMASPHPDDQRGLRAAERSIQSVAQPSSSGSRLPAAIVNGTPVTWDDLQPIMSEAAGGVALQEAVLDRLLPAELASRHLAVTREEIDSERSLLIDAMVRDSRASPADAERILDQIRRARGLGEVRFARLLERNAAMRKIVAPNVQISEEEIGQAYTMLHGPRYRIRVIIIRSRPEAGRIRDEIEAGTGTLRARFIEAAVKYSTDPSAARGGLTEPISAADPAYPVSVRDALPSLKEGEMSQVLAVDNGYALAFMEQVIPADGVSLAGAANEVRAQVRQRRERIAMDDLARQLLRDAKISPLDRGLEWSLRNSTTGAP